MTTAELISTDPVCEEEVEDLLHRFQTNLPNEVKIRIRNRHWLPQRCLVRREMNLYKLYHPLERFRREEKTVLSSMGSIGDIHAE